MGLLQRLTVLVALIGLVSCGSVIKVDTPPSAPRTTTTTEHRQDRNYEIGKEMVGYVGEAIVERKVLEIQQSEIITDGLIAASDFSVNYPPFGHKAHLKAGMPVEVVGTTERDGKRYRIVRLPAAFRA